MIRSGKPTDNGLCESFNGRLCDEFLNVSEFTSLDLPRLLSRPGVMITMITDPMARSED